MVLLNSAGRGASGIFTVLYSSAFNAAQSEKVLFVSLSLFQASTSISLITICSLRLNRSDLAKSVPFS